MKKPLIVLSFVFFFNIFPLSSGVITSPPPFDWRGLPLIDLRAEHYTQHPDLVIADEKTEVTYSGQNSTIKRSVIYYIRSKKGAELLKNISLPESFDKGYSGLMLQQGRRDLNSGTVAESFKVNLFAAREISGKDWREIRNDYRYKKRRWLQRTGEILHDEVPEYSLEGITQKMFVQVYYEASFESHYGTDIFYFHDRYPKAKTRYQFHHITERRFDGPNYCIWFNVPDSSVKRQKNYGKENVTTTVTFSLSNIEAVNYSQNALKANILPHIVFDFSFYTLSKNLYYNGGVVESESDLIRPKDFQWFNIADTNWSFERRTYKTDRDLRKLMRQFPIVKNDSGVVSFLKAFRDTIAAFRYLSQNQLFYNESHLLNIPVYDHFSRRRFHEKAESVLEDMLYESGVFFYYGNVMDKRFGNHDIQTRAHFPYEFEFILIPEGEKFHFLLPRPDGIKYLPDELPYYYEGGTVALFPHNLQKSDKTKAAKYSRFMKLHNGSDNENVRVENATLDFDVPQQKAVYSGKVNLVGQYSTLLRHYYLNEPIDSTVAPSYFKKCTEKPGAGKIQIKLSSKSSEYPFRYNFNCSETLQLSLAENLDMTGWFSFVLNKKLLPELPTSDYYFDFAFTDVYNFVLNFNQSVVIKNKEEFNYNISNKYFEMRSELLEQEGASYLVKVKCQVKTSSIRYEDMKLLDELLAALENINNFKCQLEKL